MHVRATRGVIQALPAFIRTMSILPNISKFTHFFVSDVIETDFSTSSNHNVSMQPRLHRLVPQHVPLCGRVRVDRRSGISHKASETVLTTSETALTSGQDDFVVPKTRVIRTFCVNLYKGYSYLKLNELEELPCFGVTIWQPSQLLWSALYYFSSNSFPFANLEKIEI